MMFAPFAIMILTSGLKRYVLEAYANNNDQRITQIVSTMFPLLCIAGFCLFLTGLILALYIDQVFRIAPDFVGDARVMLILLMFSSAVRLSMEAYGSGLFVRQRFVLQNIIDLSTECIRLSLLLFLLLGINTSVVWVVVASVVADLINTAGITLFSLRLVPSQRFRRGQFNWSIARELASFGGWSSLCGFAGMIRKAADPIILNRLATPLDVTCFHLGAIVPNRLEIIINNSFTNSVAPVVIGMHAQKKEEKLKSTYLRMGRLALWGFLLVVAPLVVYHENIVRLYVGDTYLAAGTVMLLLLGWYPIFYGNVLHTELAKAQIRMRSLAIRDVISASCNLMLTVILVGYYQMGAIGAAAATFVTHGLGSMLLLWPFGMRMVGAAWSEVRQDILLPGLAPFLIAMVTMEGTAVVFPVQSWLILGLNVAIGSCVYLVIVWFVMKEVDKRQFQEFVRYIRERKWSRPKTEFI